MISIDRDIVDVLKERWEQPEVFTELISPEDIGFLLNEEANNANRKEYPDRVFGLDIRKAFSFLKPKLDTFLKYPYRVSGGNFFSTSYPYRIHADTGINNREKPYKIIVIPLDVINKHGEEVDYSKNILSVLDRRWYHQAAFFIKGNEYQASKFNEYNVNIMVMSWLITKLNRHFLKMFGKRIFRIFCMKVLMDLA